MMQVRLRQDVQRRVPGHLPEEDDGAEPDRGGPPERGAGGGPHGGCGGPGRPPKSCDHAPGAAKLDGVVTSVVMKLLATLPQHQHLANCM